MNKKAHNVVSIWSKRIRGCSVEACRHQHHALGLCRGHYDRQRRTGQTSPDRPLGRPLPRLELCGCAEPRVGVSGVVCARCGRPNLAAMVDPAEPFVLNAAVTAPRPGLVVNVL